MEKKPHELKQLILSKLERVSGPDQSGFYAARCPFHDDKTPSLSLKDGYKCYGCDEHGSLSKLATYLGVDGTSESGSRWSEEDADLELSRRGLTPDTIGQFDIRAVPEKRAWRYPSNRPETFRYKAWPATNDARYWWEGPTRGAELYGLESANSIHDAGENSKAAYWLVEGEPDVWIMQQAGLPAITFTHGATSVPEAAVESIIKAGIRRVNIVYDRDTAGWRGRKKAAMELRQAGVEVDILDLPDSLPPGGDLTDLYNVLERDDGEFRQRVAGLEKVELASDQAVSDGQSFRLASEIEPTEVQWLVSNRIAYKKLNLIAGHPGVGKTTLALTIAAQLSRGLLDPSLEGGRDTGRTLILSAEDGASDTLVPRLKAAGADLDQIELPTDPDFSLEWVTETISSGRYDLVIVDPWSAFFGTGNSWRETDIRKALAPLCAAADAAGTAVIFIAHLSKDGNKKAMHQVLGSVGLMATVRMAHAVLEDPEDDGLRLFGPIKQNLTTPQPAIRFRLESEPGGALKITCLGDCDVNVGVLLEEEGFKTAGPTKRACAKQFLEKLLEEGPLAVSVIHRAARAAGHAQKTAERAKGDLGVVSSKEGDHWKWTLPSD